MLLVWHGLDEARTEAARVELLEDGLRATTTQIGTDPVGYRLDATLDATGGWITRSLEVSVAGSGWSRALRLRHDGEGRWDADAQADGEVDLLAPGGDLGAVEGALDCDLGRCPLTNVMPVRRHGLHRGGEARDFLMTWVEVPSLRVIASRQRYEPVRPGVVRYVGEHRSFVGELELDEHGLVVEYPQLARRAV